MIQIGIDTGGTFTDIVIFEKGRLTVRKVLSDRKNPQNSMLKGLSDYLDRDFKLTYGTTIATNAFLEKKGGRTAFISTSGFEHILHIQRQNRINLFSLFPQKASSIVPLDMCFGIEERTLADGSVDKMLSKHSLENLLIRLKKKKAESVSIVFLHSYRNETNEKIAEEFFREKGFFVSASYSILPEQREYERAVAATLNVYLMPAVHRHIEQIKGLIKKPFYIMQSVGGFLSPESAQETPIKTILSGPVGGVIAARYFRETKDQKLITLDMGGTSTDISLIDDDIIITQESELENLPIRIPTVFIKTIGAGGGSIAWFDKAGVLKLGPHSAGADPGPACYGRSDLCTLTDAYVVLGYILPEVFLGGNMEIFEKKSQKAVKNIAETMNKSIEETAEGIIDLSIILMEKALRNVTLQKGYDPGKFSLMPFGGAGGLASVMLAEKLAIKNVIIPPYQGVFSAIGMLLAKSARETSQSVLKPASQISIKELNINYIRLEERIRMEISRDFDTLPDIVFQRTLDIRYRGQSYYLNIPFNKGNSIKKIISLFHKTHKSIYSTCFENKEAEIVNIRVKGMAGQKTLRLPPEESGSGKASFRRSKVFYNKEYIDALFYRKECIKHSEVITGPAVISAKYSTAFIPPGYYGRKTMKGNIVIQKNGIR